MRINRRDAYSEDEKYGPQVTLRRNFENDGTGTFKFAGAAVYVGGWRVASFKTDKGAVRRARREEFANPGPYKIDGHDLDGWPYRVDEWLGPWRMTKCCHAAISCMADDPTPYCKACFHTVPWENDAPARLSEAVAS